MSGSKILIFVILILIVGIGAFIFLQIPKEEPKSVTTMPTEPSQKSEEEIISPKTTEELSILVVFDNYQVEAGLATSWGFGCVAKMGDKMILFDTGGDGEILLSNMNKLAVDLQKISTVVLSHAHGDHTGGLLDFLDKNNNVVVYLLKSFPQNFKEQIKAKGAEVVEIDEPIKISENIYSTGEMEQYPEEALVIDSSKGLIIITGCAHPGIIEIIKKAKELYGDEVYIVMGGFHLMGMAESEIRNIVKEFQELGVQKAAPSHCSGDTTRRIFQEVYGENYIESGAGAKIEI